MGKTSHLFDNLFFQKPSYDFFNSMRYSFVHDVVQQYVYYIPVDYELNKSNVYGESKNKIFQKPIKIYCIVDNEDPTPNQDNQLVESDWNVSVYLAPEDVNAKGIYIKDGDVMMFDGKFYEIKNHILGQKYPFYKVTCQLARGEFFDINFTEDEVDF